MIPSPPPAHHATTPEPPPTLAELVAKARHPKQPKTAQLEAHRAELLRLRREGDSVEVLARALRGLGVEISAEALRLWLNRQLRRKAAKRGRVTRAVTPQEPMPASPPPPPEPSAIVERVAVAAGVVADTVVTPTVTPIEVTPPSPAPVAAVSTASPPSVPLPQSGSGPGTTGPAKPYTPWKNNFTPLIIDSCPREPRTAPGNS